jgi:hypothetical protein
MNVTDQEIARLISIKQTTRKSYADLADMIYGDRTLASTLRSHMRRYKRLLLPLPEPKLSSPIITAPDVNTLVIADLHAPYQNTSVLQQAIDLAISAGITHVDIAGDIHNFSALSSHSKGEPTTPVETDIQHSRQILSVLQQQFDQIYVMSGNHDEYFTKKRGGTFQDLIYNEVLQGKHQNVIVTNDDYILRGDKWVIGHLSSYDDTPGILAAKISDLMDRNVAVGHDHISGHSYGRKGYIGISVGAMLTPDRFWYKQRRLSTFPPFMVGFLLIIDGKPYHFSDTGNTELNGEWHDFRYWKTYFKEGRQYE